MATNTKVTLVKKDFSNFCLLDPKIFYQHKEETADVHFAIEIDGHIASLIPAHKIVLAARSKVFYTMFYGELKEGNNVKIVDTSVKGFEHFLTVFYLDKVQITTENIGEFTNLCNKYDVQRGLKMCEYFLLANTETDELCTQLAFAIKFNMKKLQMHCEEKIKSNVIELFDSDDFIECSSDVLKIILQLCHDSYFPMGMFMSCMDWARNACKAKNSDESDVQNLRRVLGECFYFIPFTKMNANEFLHITSAFEKLFTIEEQFDVMSYIATGEINDFIKKFDNILDSYQFDWNEDKLIIWARNNVDFDVCNIASNALTTFSSTSELLLGGINFVEIKSVYSTKHLSGTINITNHTKKSSTKQVLEKIPFASIVELNKPCKLEFRLKKPLIIEPNIFYTIHVQFLENIPVVKNRLEYLKYFEIYEYGDGMHIITKQLLENTEINMIEESDTPIVSSLSFQLHK